MSRIVNVINHTLSGSKKIVMAGIASLLFSVAFFAGTASAVSPCGSNNICMFVDANYSGLYTEYYAPVGLGCHNVSSTFNDKISSIDNNNGRTISVYKDSNCPSWAFHRTFTGDFQNFAGTGYNDEISSVRFE